MTDTPRPTERDTCSICGALSPGEHGAGCLASSPAPAGLDVERLGLSDEQTAILREHLAKRQQTVVEFFGDVLMEYGLGRATGKDYRPEARMSLALRWLGLSEEQVRAIRDDTGEWLVNVTPRPETPRLGIGAALASSAAPAVSENDMNWLMALIIARASNAEYHRAKGIVLRMGGQHPEGIDATNADAFLATSPAPADTRNDFQATLDAARAAFVASSPAPAGLDVERLADWMMDHLPEYHRWMTTGWRDTMRDEAVVLARDMIRAATRPAEPVE